MERPMSSFDRLVGHDERSNRSQTRPVVLCVLFPAGIHWHISGGSFPASTVAPLPRYGCGWHGWYDWVLQRRHVRLHGRPALCFTTLYLCTNCSSSLMTMYLKLSPFDATTTQIGLVNTTVSVSRWISLMIVLPFLLQRSFTEIALIRLSGFASTCAAVAFSQVVSIEQMLVAVAAQGLDVMVLPCSSWNKKLGLFRGRIK